MDRLSAGQLVEAIEVILLALLYCGYWLVVKCAEKVVGHG